MPASAQIISIPLKRRTRPITMERRLWALWLQRWRERHALRRLLRQSDATLRDVGLTRKRAEMLARKPFWRA